MADAVTTKIVHQDANRIVVHLTNISDGTGESAVAKVDKSTLLSRLGIEPVSLEIERVEYACVGMLVTLLWDHTTDEKAMVLNGNGCFDFTRPFGGAPNGTSLKDARAAGDTGDILLTTTGHTSGDTYAITLWLYKAPT